MPSTPNTEIESLLREFFARMADELKSLAGYHGSVTLGWWTNPRGITMSYLSWLPTEDAAADSLDLSFTLVPVSDSEVNVLFDLAWSSGELLQELFSDRLSFASPASLAGQITPILEEHRETALIALKQRLDLQN